MVRTRGSDYGGAGEGGRRSAWQSGGLGYTIEMYIQEGHMQVSKWGNSLAVRLPAAVVEALELKEGEEIEIRIVRDRVFEVSRDQRKPQALARLRKLRRALPAGFVFDREQTHARR